MFVNSNKEEKKYIWQERVQAFLGQHPKTFITEISSQAVMNGNRSIAR